MEIMDYLQKLREIKDVAFATVDQNGGPRVRIIDVMLVEQGALYFVTARGKAFYQELLASGQVAICALTQDFKSIRLQGRAERLPDQRYWLDRIFAENPVMQTVYPGESRYILETFCIREGELEAFDLGCAPVVRESARLGGGTPCEQGFAIGVECIGCGACARQCPQQCIETGTPYHIRQRNCLHCGLCAEICAVKAIKPIGKEALCCNRS